MSLLCMGLALVAIPLAWMRVDGEKEDVIVREETLSGDPEAASGIAVQVSSHWDRHLLWDTKCTVGEGGEAESRFAFSSEGVEWEWADRKAAEMDFLYGGGFGTCQGEGYLGARPEDLPYPEVVRAVADRAEAGKEYAETVRIGDYCEYYPVAFEISGTSVTYQGDYQEEMDYLRSLFQIRTAEDCLELRLEKDEAGLLVSLSGQKKGQPGDIMIADASAFVKTGMYYAFSCEDGETGERTDRGENAGIFYLPFQQEESSISVDLGKMEKVCGLPEDAVPVGMLLDEEKGYLYLSVKGKHDYSLIVYRLDQEEPVFAQRVALGQERLFLTGDAAGESVRLEDTDAELALAPTSFCGMSREDGGLLMTWSDNGFSFVAEAEGECELWCSGQFPEQPEEEFMGTDQGWVRNHMFPLERECLFDGERLVLAAFEDWDSLNVLLAVYDRRGELYSGRYLQFEEPNIDTWDKVLPQGRDHDTWLWSRLMDRYGSMGPEGTRPLKLLWDMDARKGD